MPPLTRVRERGVRASTVPPSGLSGGCRPRAALTFSPALPLPAAAACNYFGIKLVHLPVNSSTFRLDAGAVERAITRNTIGIVCSAPCFPQGAWSRRVAATQAALLPLRRTSLSAHTEPPMSAIIFCHPRECRRVANWRLLTLRPPRPRRRRGPCGGDRCPRAAPRHPRARGLLPRLLPDPLRGGGHRPQAAQV